MDARIALTGKVPDVVGAYQNALANRQSLEMGQMKNALAAQEMADMQQARDFEASPEGQKKKQLKVQRESQMAALEDIKANLPFVTPENWGEFGNYMQTQYGNAGVFGQPYDPKAHEQMLINSGIKKQPGQGAAEYSGAPIIGEDGGIYVINKRTGKLESAGMRPGLRPTQEIEYQEQLSSRKAEAAARGEASAKINNPQAIASLDSTISAVNSLVGHKGKSAATGLSAIGNVAALPGSDRKDFLVRLDQLKNKLFLQARQDLKGGGAITDYEGQKAENAMAQLDAAQSEDQFNAALKELQDALMSARDKMAAASVGTNNQPSRRQPKGYISREKLEQRAAERGITVDKAFEEATALGYELR